METTAFARSLAAITCLACLPCPASAQTDVIFDDGFEGPVDPASLVASSSDDGTPLTACLVAGSGARVVVWTDLRYVSGARVRNAVVTMGGAPATRSVAQPGVYWREVVADAAPGDVIVPVAASTSAGTVLLASTVTLTHVAANGTSGGTGGCAPGDGNLRVRAVAAENGDPIPGARVLVGLTETAPFEHNPESLFGGPSTPGSNVAVTDGSGYASFYDYGNGLAGALTTTAGDDDRAYFTVVDAGASDLVLPLSMLHPAVPTTTYDNGGATSMPPRLNCGYMQFGILLPKLSLDRFSAFRLQDVLSPLRCVDAGVAGQQRIPGNFYVPNQSIGAPPFCLASISAPWALDLKDTASTGSTETLGMVFGQAPLSAVQGGSLVTLLGAFQHQEIGFIKDETVPTSPTSGRTVPLDSTYPVTLTVNLGGLPVDLDVLGLTSADYSGANGTGPLGLLGVAVKPYNSAGMSVVIRNSGLTGPSAPTGVRRLASASALYLEPVAPRVVPPNRLNAQTTRLIRDNGAGGPPFGGSASVAVTADDFLGLSAAAFTGPGTFTWDDATANGNAPLYSVHELTVRKRSHLPVLACDTTNEVRESFDTQWVVVRPFAATCGLQECFTLPMLPASFPRAMAGPQQRSGFEQRIGSGTACAGPGDCIAGETCVDPDAAGARVQMCMGGAGMAADPYTVEDYAWRLHVYYLGLAPAFDFDAFEFSTRVDWLTHESSNTVLFN
jgi:hypothetical protein